MEKAEYENMYRAEETHFYYVSLHKIILSFFKRYAPHKKNLKILDAGCGTGKLAELMLGFGNVVGVDMSDEGLRFARKRGISVKKASVAKLPFRSKSFDIVTSIDVLYHKAVGDDISALKEMYRVLKPNGILILRVQAIPWLNLSHDKYVHGIRRYSKDILREKLLKVGFHTEKLSYINAVLAPIGIIEHFIQNSFPPSQNHSSVKQTNYLLNSIMTTIISSEIKLLSIINIPFGLGLIAVCRKN